jgi:hypothetical protein
MALRGIGVLATLWGGAFGIDIKLRGSKNMCVGMQCIIAAVAGTVHASAAFVVVIVFVIDAVWVPVVVMAVVVGEANSSC